MEKLTCKIEERTPESGLFGVVVTIGKHSAFIDNEDVKEGTLQALGICKMLIEKNNEPNS